MTIVTGPLWHHLKRGSVLAKKNRIDCHASRWCYRYPVQMVTCASHKECASDPAQSDLIYQIRLLNISAQMRTRVKLSAAWWVAAKDTFFLRSSLALSHKTMFYWSSSTRKVHNRFNFIDMSGLFRRSRDKRTFLSVKACTSFSLFSQTLINMITVLLTALIWISWRNLVIFVKNHI